MKIEMDIPNINKQRKVVAELEKVIALMDLLKNQLGLLDDLVKSKAVIQKSLEKAQLLFDSLMQKYFG
ncbi:MAG: hypothetical protein ACI4D9_08110 [Lachnospiraceae bacterium]